MTFLAGANNSGKTSIIEFIRNVIDNTRCNLSVDDLPISYAKY